MARKLKAEDVLQRIRDAGADGLPADARVLLKKWRQDADPRHLSAMLAAMEANKEVCRITRQTGDGKFHPFLVAC